ncbi:MAG TPA: hypothetical protein VH500_14730 [Nitrososphaeraceae archaeon]|jgi:Spy/CpxP family protein refolding chaperone
MNLRAIFVIVTLVATMATVGILSVSEPAQAHHSVSHGHGHGGHCGHHGGHNGGGDGPNGGGGGDHANH